VLKQVAPLTCSMSPCHMMIFRWNKTGFNVKFDNEKTHQFCTQGYIIRAHAIGGVVKGALTSIIGSCFMNGWMIRTMNNYRVCSIVCIDTSSLAYVLTKRMWYIWS